MFPRRSTFIYIEEQRSENPFIAKQFIAVGINSPIQAGLDQLLSRQAILHFLHCWSRRQLFQSAIFCDGGLQKSKNFRMLMRIVLEKCLLLKRKERQ